MGPSLKIYFQSEEELHNVQLLAASHNMGIKEFALFCIRKTGHEILKEREETLKSANEHSDRLSEAEAEAEAEDEAEGK